MSCFIENGKKITEVEFYKKYLENANTVEGLKTLYLITVNDIIEGLDEEYKNSNSSDALGVSKLIDHHSNYTNELWVPEIDLQNYIRNVMEAKRDINSPYKSLYDNFEILARNILPSNSSDENIEKEIKKLIEEDFEEKGILSIFGTAIHDLLSRKINEHFNNKTHEDGKSFEDKFNEVIDEIVINGEINKKNILPYIENGARNKEDLRKTFEHIIDGAFSIIETKMKEAGEGAKIYSEIGIITDLSKPLQDKLSSNIYTKARGICDIIIVDEKGKVQIIDFKCANKPSKDWISAKEIHNQYQLGVYRAILQSKGIDFNDIKIFNLPIRVPQNNILDSQVEDLIDVVDQSKGNLNVAGSYTEKINNIVPVSILNSSSIKQTYDKCQEDYEAIIDINDDEKLNALIEDEINKNNSDIKLGKYKGKQYSSPEEAKNKVKEEIQKRIDKNIKIYESLLNKINEYKKNNKNESLSLDSFKLHTSTQEIIRKYAENPDYTIIEHQAFASKGIIAFYNKRTHQIDFISVHTECKPEFKFKNGFDESADLSTLLGKYFTREQIIKDGILKEDEIIETTSANLAIMETLSIINTLAEDLKKTDPNLTLGEISVININSTSIKPVRLLNHKKFKKNLSILIDQAGKSDLKYNLDQFATINKLQIFKLYLDDIIQKGKVSEDISIKNKAETYKRIKDNIDRINDQTEGLITFIQELKKAFPELPNFTGTVTFSENDTEQMQLYMLANGALLQLKGQEINEVGKFTRYGVTVPEFLSYFEVLFTGETSEKDAQGFSKSGFLNGTFTVSPFTTPDKNLRIVSELTAAAHMKVRELHNKQAMYVNKLTEKYIESKNKNTAYKLIVGDYAKIWENLLVKDNPGDKLISSRMLIKCPFSINQDPSLDSTDIAFLKEILWEINKYRLFKEHKILESQLLQHWSDELELDLRSNSELDAELSDPESKYFQLPLKRASDERIVRKIKSFGILDFFRKLWDRMADGFNLRRVHKEIINKNEEMSWTQMYNDYDISSDKRSELINKYGVLDFEVDLNFIAVDVAYNYLRFDVFQEALVTANAYFLHLQSYAQKEGIDASSIIEAAEKQLKVSLKNQMLLDEEWTSASKILGFFKKINSFTSLAFRPLQYFKEMTVGQMTNLSRAWAQKGMENKFTVDDLWKAKQIVYGMQTKRNFNMFTGKEGISELDKIQQLCRIYGIANMDMNQLSEKTRFAQQGFAMGFSKWMYLPQTAPDFTNRMEIFVAQMIHDGVWDAYTLNEETGILEYHFKKDSRFKKLCELGFNAKSNDKEFLEQRSLYVTLYNQFIQEGRINPNDPNQAIDKLFLPDAYTIKERDAFKEFSGTVYGFYDHEERSLWDFMPFGIVMKQFQTFLTGKINLWLKGRNRNTVQGHWEQRKTEDGKPIFIKVVEVDGKLGTQETTDSIDEEGNELTKAMYWEGDMAEGLLQSIAYTFHDLFTADFDSIKNNKQRLANLKLALHDIVMGIIIYNLLKLFFTEGTGKLSDVDPEIQIPYQVLTRALVEFDPVNSLTSMSWEPSFYTNLVNIKNDGVKLLTGDREIAEALQRRIVAIKDLVPQE